MKTSCEDTAFNSCVFTKSNRIIRTPNIFMYFKGGEKNEV